MKKLKKGLSKFLATTLSVALMAQPAMTAFADELVPKAVAEEMEALAGVPSVMSLLPLEEKRAYLYMNDYTDEELESVPLETVLERLVDSRGQHIEIDESATIVWTTFPDEEGNIIYDNHTFLDRDETVNLNFSRYSSVDIEMIVGSGKQLDSTNVRYEIDVRFGELYEDFDFEFYEKETETYMDQEMIQCETSYILDELEIPVTQVHFVTSAHQAGNEYYMNIYPYASERDGFPNIQLDIYPMKEFVEYQQDGAELDGAVTGSVISDQGIENWYTGTFATVNTAESYLESDNLFCLVYSDTETGEMLGYHGLELLVAADANVIDGALWTYEDGEMVNVTRRTYTDDDTNFYLNLDLNSDDENKVYGDYGHNYIHFSMDYDYVGDEEYYAIFEPNDNIEKVVLGRFDSLEEAEAENAVDITEEILPEEGAEAPYGYLDNFYLYSKRITVFFKDGTHRQYYMYSYGGKSTDDDDATEYDLAPVVNQADPYFRVNGAVDYDTFEVENSYDQTLDTLYGFGYQTVFILESYDEEQEIDLSSVIPRFWTPDDVKAHVGTEQISGESVQDFSDGPVYYAVHIGDKLKNYNVTFAKKTSGPKLFVNGPDEREIFLDEYFENRHDILIANLGDEELTGLNVELIGAKNVVLDEYWNLGGEDNDTLAPFKETYLDDMANLAKIRLRPQEATDSNATVKGEIKGKLKIWADGQDPIYINLTGHAGNPEIVTATMSNAVEYVPYSFVVGTDNMHDWNKVTFSIEDGELPEGLKLYPATGEIYGVPLETGEFPITVMAEYSREEFEPSYADFVLTVKDNTNENVYKASDKGYEIKEHIGTEIAAGTYDFLLEDFIEQTFVSNGEYDEFIDFWFNGKKLEAGEDYDKEEGSTKITIRSQTFREHAVSGANTIAAEFRVDGDKTKELKRTAQNFRMNIPERDDDEDEDDDEEEYTSNKNTTKKPAVTAPAADPNFVFTDQSWIKDDFGWWVKKADGTWLASTWYLLPYMGTMEWYYFGADGYMKTGWFQDVDGNKYYLHPISDGTMGRMYYGWQLIDGKWYYFNEVSDGTKGALKTNAWIGDYYVDANGVWTE